MAEDKVLFLPEKNVFFFFVLSGWWESWVTQKWESWKCLCDFCCEEDEPGTFLSGMCDLRFSFFLFACTVKKGELGFVIFGGIRFLSKNMVFKLDEEDPSGSFWRWSVGFVRFHFIYFGERLRDLFFAYTCIGIWSCLLWSCVGVGLPSVNDFCFLFVWTYDHLPVIHQIRFCFSDSDQISLSTPFP